MGAHPCVRLGLPARREPDRTEVSCQDEGASGAAASDCDISPLRGIRSDLPNARPGSDPPSGGNPTTWACAAAHARRDRCRAGDVRAVHELLDRPPVVPRGRLQQRVHHRADDQGTALPRVRRAHGGRDRGQHVAGVPQPARLSRGLARTAEPGALPAGRRSRSARSSSSGCLRCSACLPARRRRRSGRRSSCGATASRSASTIRSSAATCRSSSSTTPGCGSCCRSCSACWCSRCSSRSSRTTCTAASGCRLRAIARRARRASRSPSCSACSCSSRRRRTGSTATGSPSRRASSSSGSPTPTSTRCCRPN